MIILEVLVLLSLFSIACFIFFKLNERLHNNSNKNMKNYVQQHYKETIDANNEAGTDQS